ncbi:MAG: beta-propeller fold lactonase family protein [Chitinophagaceae bacterium]|nr:beta-propeller fold lactonase family protein [Chitinophagaceae bacterium]
MRKLLYIAIVVLLAISCEKETEHRAKNTVVYIQTNNYQDNQNAVLAYRHKEDGTLEAVPGSPFLTGGAGLGNPKQILGPADSDTEIKISKDGKFLLAVNSGSNTIAVMRIQSNGGLTPVEGSPFPSGGQTPVSIDVYNKHVFVVNKSQDPLHTINQNPNYITFTIDNNGRLTQVPDSKVETFAGSSPAQALVSNNGKFLFGADFLGFMLNPPKGTLRSFTINSSGTITPVAGTPQSIPGMGGALGLWQHPKENILYVGFPMQAKLGIYDINSASGALTFQSTVEAGGGICWVRTNKNGDKLYLLNSAENTVGMYNSSAPMSPSSLGKLKLKESGPTYVDMEMEFPTSQPFSLGFSPSEKYLYVVNQHTNPDFSVGNYNYFHVLHVAEDGRLTEPGEPLQLPVPNIYRPRGIAVIQTSL